MTWIMENMTLRNSLALVGIAIGLFPLSPVDILFHELGHCFGLVVSRILLLKRFRGKLNLRVELHTINGLVFTQGIAKSDLYLYLSNERNDNNYPKHPWIIRFNALSGFMFSSLLYCFVLYMSVKDGVYIIGGISAFFIIRELFMFLVSRRSQSDRKLLFNPRMFYYGAWNHSCNSGCPYSDDRK